MKVLRLFKSLFNVVICVLFIFYQDNVDYVARNKVGIIIFFAHQHKAAGVKTKQKQRLRRLLIRCSLC